MINSLFRWRKIIKFYNVTQHLSTSCSYCVYKCLDFYWKKTIMKYIVRLFIMFQGRLCFLLDMNSRRYTVYHNEEGVVMKFVLFLLVYILTLLRIFIEFTMWFHALTFKILQLQLEQILHIKNKNTKKMKKAKCIYVYRSAGALCQKMVCRALLTNSLAVKLLANVNGVRVSVFVTTILAPPQAI